MEEVLSATDKQSMVTSFLEIAVGQSADTARQFLQVCNPSFSVSIFHALLYSSLPLSVSHSLSPSCGAVACDSQLFK